MKKFEDLNLPSALVDLFATRFAGIRQWQVSSPNTRGDVSIHYQGLRLDLRDIGEGMSGEYNPQDPGDTPLLRLNLHHRHPATGELTELPDTSCCTGVDATAPWVARLDAASRAFILMFIHTGPGPDIEQGEDAGDWGQDLKALCEAASHISDMDDPGFVHKAIEIKRVATSHEALLEQTPQSPSHSARPPRV